MLELDRAAVVAGLAIVAAGEAVEVVAVDVGRLVDVVLAAVGAQGQRDAVVGHVVGFDVVVADGQAGVGAQAEGEGRCHAPATDVHGITAGDVGFVLHQVQPERRGVGHLLVQVEGGALGLVEPEVKPPL